jgi:hypothetical protein
MRHTSGHGRGGGMWWWWCIYFIAFKCLPLSLTAIENVILIVNCLLHNWKGIVGSDGLNYGY